MTDDQKYNSVKPGASQHAFKIGINKKKMYYKQTTVANTYVEACY